MIIEVFAMESGLLRAKQLLAKEGPKKARYHLAAVKVYFNDIMPNIVHWAKQLLAASAEGDDLIAHIDAVNQLASCQPLDTIALRRLVAQKVIRGRKYPF